MASEPVRANWMSPGAPRAQKPSWLRLAAVSAPAASPSPPPIVEVIPSEPPPRSFRQPSMPPPPSSRRVPPQIQTTREVELESELMQLHAELQRVMTENENMKARVMEESEPAIVALALAIAKRVVGREVAADPQVVHAWIREAQGLMPSGSVYVASDIEGVESAQIDATLAAGTAEVRDDGSVIVVGTDARMAAMADALGVDS
ncbi:MAG: FliH/SctL family protein [Labilithrix sp.]